MTNRFVMRPEGAVRRGFTLVELVVVVLILGILAAVAAPRMFDTATEARENSTRQSLAVVRDAIQLYRAQTGAYPDSSSLATDLEPYLSGQFPAVQVGENTNADVGDATGQSPITTEVSGGAGWAYNPTTGELRINDSSFIQW